MANGVHHTGYDITVHLDEPDLGHPHRPGLLEEITQPINHRDRQLLQCLEHHEHGICHAEDDDRSPWMTIRRRTINGETSLVAAHLPVRQKPTPEESNKHKAMKDRIARAASRHGLSAHVESRTLDSAVRNDVLVTGPGDRRIGWEAQYSPITAGTVRRRSQAAADRGITPLWVTNSDKAALIDRAPWAQVDDVPWQHIASSLALLVRAGVRHLQRWKCEASSERPCPVNGSHCGRLHAQWHLPMLCIPPKPATHLDELVVTSADGEHVPMKIPDQRDPRRWSRMWVPAGDRDEWLDVVGPGDGPEDDVDERPEAGLTFTRRPLDRACRYGEDPLAFNDPRARRAAVDATGLHTFDDIPERLFRIPQQATGPLQITGQQRRALAAHYGCLTWNIGPCAGCAEPIHRYGPGAAHACPTCRARTAR